MEDTECPRDGCDGTQVYKGITDGMHVWECDDKLCSDSLLESVN